MFGKLLSILAMFSILAVTPNAALSSIYTGTYMFTASGNDDNIDEVESLINQWFSINNIHHHAELTYLGKDDVGGGKTGEWYWEEPVKYYSVKGGNQYSVFWVDPSQTTGKWSTEFLLNGGGNHPDMSHISFWTNEDTYDTHPTPEPSTVALMSLGLASLVGTGLCRKRS